MEERDPVTLGEGIDRGTFLLDISAAAKSLRVEERQAREMLLPQEVHEFWNGWKVLFFEHNGQTCYIVKRPNELPAIGIPDKTTVNGYIAVVNLEAYQEAVAEL